MAVCSICGVEHASCTGMIKMQYEPVDIPGRQQRTGGLYTATEHLYLNSRGVVVGHKDPDKQVKLVSKGSTIPMEEAAKYGLVKLSTEPLRVIIPEPEEEYEEPEAKSPTALPVLDLPVEQMGSEAKPEAVSVPLKPAESAQPAAATTKSWGYAQKPKRRKRMPRS